MYLQAHECMAVSNMAYHVNAVGQQLGPRTHPIAIMYEEKP